MEAIIEKIKKLMKQAESASQIGSLAEAETFLAKANALILQHNIDQIDLEEKEGVVIKHGKNRLSYKDNQAGNRWKICLLEVLADSNLCSYTFNSKSLTACLVGKEENILIVEFLYHQLSERLFLMAKNYYKALPDCERGNGNNDGIRRKVLQSYLTGAVYGLGEKLKDQLENMGSQVYALVVNNKAKLDDFLKDVKEKGFKEISDNDAKALQVGYKDALGMNIHQGIKATEQEASKIKLLN